MKHFICLLLVAVISTSSFSIAQDYLKYLPGYEPDISNVQDTTLGLNVRAGIGMGWSITFIKSKPALLKGIGTSGSGMMFPGSVAIYYKSLPFTALIDLEIGYAIFDDKKQFTEYTTGGERTSSVNMLHGSVAVGIYYPLIIFTHQYGLLANPSAGLSLHFGTGFYTGSRGISDCANCSKENINFLSGLFLEPALQVFLGRAFNFSFSYRVYEKYSELIDNYAFKLIFLFGVL
jgi:hypothetical protein